jgi:pyridoxal 5'-phosphate synthase pdxT subunit
MKIGVLALQGDFAEHLQAIEQCGAQGLPIRRSFQLEELDGLIIPGGESTTIAKLTNSDNTIFDTITNKIKSGMPVYGTCMGAIFLANEIEGSTQGRLGLMSIKVRRNGFGPQKASFESYIDVPCLADNGSKNETFHAVFIRAPLILSHSPEVTVLAKLDQSENENVIMARQNNMLVSTFHPELTGDLRIHQYFLSMIDVS